MTNLRKEKIYIPSNINFKYSGWRLNLFHKSKNLTIKFPKHTHFIQTGRYLCVDKYAVASSLFGALLRKTKVLIRGFAFQYVVRLLLVGVGYRVRIEEPYIIFRLGYSHEIKLLKPNNIDIILIKYNQLKLFSSYYEEIQQFIYKLRHYRPPEPFKGKGIIYFGENVRRKEGKKKKI